MILLRVAVMLFGYYFPNNFELFIFLASKHAVYNVPKCQFYDVELVLYGDGLLS